MYIITISIRRKPPTEERQVLRPLYKRQGSGVWGLVLGVKHVESRVLRV